MEEIKQKARVIVDTQTQNVLLVTVGSEEFTEREAAKLAANGVTTSTGCCRIKCQGCYALHSIHQRVVDEIKKKKAEKKREKDTGGNRGIGPGYERHHAGFPVQGSIERPHKEVVVRHRVVSKSDLGGRQ